MQMKTPKRTKRNQDKRFPKPKDSTATNIKRKRCSGSFGRIGWMEDGKDERGMRKRRTKDRGKFLCP